MTSNSPTTAPGPARQGPSLQLTLRWERVPWEALLYAAVFMAATAMRLWDLDARAYHYDESIHAYDSWGLYKGNGYTHSPWAHGPFMYMVQAGGFFLFGDNDWAARVFPALFGSAIVLMPLLLRDYLGRWGALAAAALLAFSPSLLYVSRFGREDIYAVAFDLALVVALWRYVQDRRARWLYLAAISLTLTFSTKESAYLSIVAVGSFLAAWWARSWLPILWSGAQNKGIRLLARLRPWKLEPAHLFLFFIAALTLPLGSAGVGVLIEKLPGDLVLVRPQDPGLGAGVVGSPQGDAAYAVAAIIASALFVGSVLIGLLLRRPVFFIAFGLFWAIFFILHTTFFSNMAGMGTGVWQSLGYWISQQPVERAGQPWYYYLMLLSLYEFLPFFFGIGAVAWYAWKRGAEFVVVAAAVTAVAGLVVWGVYQATDEKFVFMLLPLGAGLMAITYLALKKGGVFEWFLVHWALVTLLLYIVAGEKMPWLVTHLALPLALLAGRFLGHLPDAIRWRQALRRGGVLLLFVAPLAVVLALSLDEAWEGGLGPFRRDVWTVEFWRGVWTSAGPSVAAAFLFAGAVWVWWRVGQARAVCLVGVSLLAFMAFFTFRAGVQASFANDDDAREMIVYSQVSGDIPPIVERINRLALETGKGKDMKIVADTADAALAPWRWYFRNYKAIALQDMTSFNGDIDAEVVILALSNRNKITPVADRYTEGQQAHLLSWFNPWVYQNYTAGKFWDDVRSGADWKRLRQFFVYREMKTEPSFSDVVVFFRKPAA